MVIINGFDIWGKRWNEGFCVGVGGGVGGVVEGGGMGF